MARCWERSTKCVETEQKGRVHIMQTSVKTIEVIDRNGDGSETRMMSIRMSNGELKSCLLRRLLRDREVRHFSTDLVWDLAREIKRLAIICDEPPFPDPVLAGSLAYLADNSGEVTPAPTLLRRLLDRRDELAKKCRTLPSWKENSAWRRAKELTA